MSLRPLWITALVLANANFMVHVAGPAALNTEGRPAPCECGEENRQVAGPVEQADARELAGSLRRFLGPVNCEEDCTYLDSMTQYWCFDAGDRCNDNYPWHHNYEKERTKRLYQCPAGETYEYRVKCSAWVNSGCCGSADSSTPICPNPGQKYCGGSWP